MSAFSRAMKWIAHEYVGLLVFVVTIALVLFVGFVGLPFIHSSSSQSSEGKTGPDSNQAFAGRPKGQKGAFKRPGQQQERSDAGPKKLADDREQKQKVADSKADAEPTRRDAAAMLELGKEFLSAGKNDMAAVQFNKVISDYPGTAAAQEAAALLKKIQ